MMTYSVIRYIHLKSFNLCLSLRLPQNPIFVLTQMALPPQIFSPSIVLILMQILGSNRSLIAYGFCFFCLIFVTSANQLIFHSGCRSKSAPILLLSQFCHWFHFLAILSQRSLQPASPLKELIFFGYLYCSLHQAASLAAQRYCSLLIVPTKSLLNRFWSFIGREITGLNRYQWQPRSLSLNVSAAHRFHFLTAHHWLNMILYVRYLICFLIKTLPMVLSTLLRFFLYQAHSINYSYSLHSFRHLSSTWSDSSGSIILHGRWWDF